ncbi:MAG: glycosyltransferase, partial [Halioglobus sp.]|nr:glycosyltransferase [Halioglobus sp.]
MKPSILYISYTGLLEPLGQSQVLQYLLGLAQEHRITLLTFEKPTALVDHSVLEKTKATCRQARVDWHYLHYHNKPNLLATIYDVLAGTMKAIKLARSENADVVHCRSYLGGLMGLAVKRATGAHHIFDMRGFWADERVDGGIWRKGGFKYRLFKWLERLLLCETDHIVTLTRSGRHEIYKFPYFNVGRPPISVIPTCVNLKLFQSRPEGINNGTDFTLGYVGSIGTWYLFEEVSRVVKPMFDDYPNSRFLVLNKGSHDNIRQQLSREGVDLSRVEIKAVEFDRVSDEIARMDAGIFFIKPMWS